MTTIAIVGGHGQIARHLTARLVAAGHDPVGLVRNPDHVDALESVGASGRLLDIENSGHEEFVEALRGCDAVVFAAGGGPDGNAERKRTVDLEGSTKSIAAAQALGIRRFVQISAINVDSEPDAELGEVWQAYVIAKRDADQALRASDLDWTIVRPGRLTDHPATGLVALGGDVERGDVTREDVAAVIAAVLDDDRTIGHQWNLVNGDTPIPDALTTATR